MRTHEAGAVHAESNLAPEWLAMPTDVNALCPALWSVNVARAEHGALSVAGVDVRDLAHDFGTPCYVVDEVDFRARCNMFRDGFEGADVYYAGKAFLCVATVRWIAAEGLSLDVCTRGELAVAVRGGIPMNRVAFHGNNKSAAEIDHALDVGVGRFVLDSYDEIDRLTAAASERGVRADVMVRVTVGVEAHTHEYVATAHEDQKFGFSLAAGDAARAVERVLAAPSLELLGLHAHIGSQIFDATAFNVSARRVLGLHEAVRDAHGVDLPDLCLGGGFGIAYTSQDDPAPPSRFGPELRAIVERECGAAGLAVPRLSIEPGRAIAGPAAFTLYEVGTVKRVDLGGGNRRTYVSVDGGMSDNIRPALYGAAYSCSLASRASRASPTLARVVGKHCEAGDIVVPDEFLPADVMPGDLLAVPGTGAYCRSMASNYNHVPRPPVVAVRDGEARLIVRRETERDLFRLDVG